ncbi:hypothetical protein CDL15_Pgr023108 [Punica granatum]|uniref:Transcription repressor n=1 Tax=Punica granatum TaxID=22663 RepID=A0A218X4S7_PUNGR|nr:hypothetical protein CDL15_Pgr023108 [Punica granatum]PKI53936.1 hypothetical protein CRG98_025730 [Punica granatum]
MEVEKTERKPNSRRRHDRISLSATLPADARGVFARSICTVKLSVDPFSEIRESILEIAQDAGAVSWDDVEELIYCYIALNSVELHPVIEDAFLSKFGSSKAKP